MHSAGHFRPFSRAQRAESTSGHACAPGLRYENRRNWQLLARLSRRTFGALRGIVCARWPSNSATGLWGIRLWNDPSRIRRGVGEGGRFRRGLFQARLRDWRSLGRGRSRGAGGRGERGEGRGDRGIRADGDGVGGLGGGDLGRGKDGENGHEGADGGADGGDGGDDDVGEGGGGGGGVEEGRIVG